MQRLSHYHKCMTYFTGFMTFWTRLFLNDLVIQLRFYYFFLIMLAGKVIKPGLCGSPFFTIKDSVLLTEACLYGCINWNLATGKATTLVWFITVCELCEMWQNKKANPVDVLMAFATF